MSNRSKEGYESVKLSGQQPKYLSTHSSEDELEEAKLPKHETPSHYTPRPDDLHLAPTPTQFWCGKRIIRLQDLVQLIFTISVSTAPVVGFMIYVRPRVHVGLTLSALALFVISMIFLLMTTFTEPGILPRQNEPDPVELDKKDRPNVPMGYRYCVTCRRYRPPRAKHCRFCDHCVLKFDHHCPWAGACIGERNYRYFLMFITTAEICTAHFTAITIHQFRMGMLKGELSLGEAVRAYPISAAIIIFSGCLCISLTSLLSFHLYLMILGETTNESVRGTYLVDENPYAEAFCLNCNDIFCMDIPPSEINEQNYGMKTTRSPLELIGDDDDVFEDTQSFSFLSKCWSER